MRKIFVSIMLAISSAAMAQGIDSLFVNMPDSLFPYLARAQRSELVNMQRIDTSTHAVLQSLYDGKVEILYKDADKMTLSLDTLSSMEMSVFPPVGDAVCCILRTVATPEMHTELALYDEKWNRLPTIDIDTLSLIQRPDTMSVQQYDELCKLIEFQLIEAHLVDSTTIVLKQNIPMVSVAERKKFAAILKERRMNVNELLVERKKK